MGGKCKLDRGAAGGYDEIEIRKGFFKRIQGRVWYCCPWCKRRQWPLTPGARMSGLIWRCTACGEHSAVETMSRARRARRNRAKRTGA